MDTTGHPQPLTVTCEAADCGREITTEMTLWPHLGKWYCSEKCVRNSLGADKKMR